MGAEAEAPSCPATAPIESYTGHGYPDGALHCGACECDPPIGFCGLPAMVTSSSELCPGSGTGSVHFTFGPPPGWDGTCSAANALAAGALCGSEPCVQSITITPLTLSQTGCLPIKANRVSREERLVILSCRIGADDSARLDELRHTLKARSPLSELPQLAELQRAILRMALAEAETRASFPRFVRAALDSRLPSRPQP